MSEISYHFLFTSPYDLDLPKDNCVLLPHVVPPVERCSLKVLRHVGLSLSHCWDHVDCGGCAHTRDRRSVLGIVTVLSERLTHQDLSTEKENH